MEYLSHVARYSCDDVHRFWLPYGFPQDSQLDVNRFQLPYCCLGNPVYDRFLRLLGLSSLQRNSFKDQSGHDMASKWRFRRSSSFDFNGCSTRKDKLRITFRTGDIRTYFLYLKLRNRCKSVRCCRFGWFNNDSHVWRLFWSRCIILF